MASSLKRLCLIVWFSLFVISPTFSQQLDQTFGSGGVKFTTFSPNSTNPFARSFAYGLKGFPAPNGNISVLSRFLFTFTKSPNQSGSRVVNYSQNATTATFGPAGEQQAIATDAAQQSDGKMIAVGNFNNDWFIWRFDLNGTFDTTFNFSGKRVIGFAANDDRATGVAVQPDGKILIVGSSTDVNGGVTVLLRLNADGTNDNSFGPYGNGIVLLFDGGALSQKLVLRPSGKILLLNMRQENPPLFNETVTTFFQLNSDGSPDAGFGDNGILYSYEPFQNVFVDAKAQADGKVVVLATRDFIPLGMVDVHDHEVVVTRYNQNGSLDEDFGISGRSSVNTSPPAIGTSLRYEPSGLEEARGLTIDSMGKISVVAHSAQVVPAFGNGSGPVRGRLERKFAQYILQFDVNGKLIGRNFSRQTKYDQVVSTYTPHEINGIFEQPGKGLVVFGSYTEAFYLHWPNLPLPGMSVMLSRFSSVSAVNDANNFYDYNFDGQADFAMYHASAPALSRWQMLRTDTQRNGSYSPVNYDFGLANDVPVPGDYDGDGVQDLAVFRNDTGDWFTRKVYLNNCAPMDCTELIHFGAPGDVPAPGDFDGDGKTDRAVFRPSEGNWYILLSTGGWTGLHFGQTGDMPVTGDYDDDGRSDIAVIRRNNGLMTWYILQSSNNEFVGLQFGLTTDKAAPMDYDGDGRTEIAVWRPADGNWYMLSGYTSFSAVQWGQNGDVPVPADYDGDSKADVGIFRPSEGNLYVRRSLDGSIQSHYYPGSPSDLPVASVYIR